ncbi:Predicted arabinose efflux permease, MFS family [Chitinophaga terrae (ex Kim and Jung 2007)]|uniref:Predicted arabinose efflux permease, MFS family n=1 Tax=Chitinophaga terrae (ex Kim and Jung 2007) TaxID=408074 RepID=A0A1H4GQP1_9BACT|nr:MFS transporter [Chitinophaga terrae (ex Kim and Jung 2007)]SEB10952.1 Predicted arabinose efflux permease, MFS family [Chitinophaga terrae (ex Kim and Jung 2007)]
MKKSIYAMALGAFGIITTEFGVIGVLPNLAQVFHVSLEKAGWLLSAFALTVAVSSPFITALTTNVNRKLLMSLVLAVFVVSNILSAFAPNFTVLMIARVLPAFLHPLFWNLSLAAAFKESGSKAVSVVMSGVSIATVMGVPITTYAAEFFSNWQASFFLASFVSLIAFLGLVLYVPSMPAARKAAGDSQLYVLKSPLLWLNLVSTILMLAGMFSSYGYLAAYMEKVTHMNGTQISVMLLLFGGMGVLGNWLTGRALSKNVMLTTRVFFTALILVQILAYLFGGLFVPMVILLSLWGAIHTGGFLIGNIRTTRSVPHSALEFVNSLLTSCYNIGISLGAMLGGLVIARYGVHYVVWMSVGLLAVNLGLSFITFGKKHQHTAPAAAMEKEPIMMHA